jgi:peptidoglycan/xylan/chitin deacetylase (PgdA/CDA1 family)
MVQRHLLLLTVVAGLLNVGGYYLWQNKTPTPETPTPMVQLTPNPVSAPVNAQPAPPVVVFEAPPRYNGQLVHDSKHTGSEKVIALTFDDGPWEHTPEILKILQHYDAKATFFFIGQHVQVYPQIAQQVVAAGHALGNHTWSHYTHNMDTTTAKTEIENTTARIYKATGVKTRLFRPPAGRLDSGVVDYALQKNYATIMWSIDTYDWMESTSVQSLIDSVLNHAKPGSIVLLHDGGGNRLRTIQALHPIMAGLQQQGYRFVTVPELLEMEDQEIRRAQAASAATTPTPAATPTPAPIE